MQASAHEAVVLPASPAVAAARHLPAEGAASEAEEAAGLVAVEVEVEDGAPTSH
jgi:hypothetical protein